MKKYGKYEIRWTQIYLYGSISLGNITNMTLYNMVHESPVFNYPKYQISSKWLIGNNKLNCQNLLVLENLK